MSLTAYVAANPVNRRKPCWVCSLPERGELDEAKRGGKITVRDMVRYLTAPKDVNGAGYSTDDVTIAKVEHHFRNRHHESLH